MNHGLLRPFIGERPLSAGSQRGWLIFLFGAPLAFLLSVYLQGPRDQSRKPLVTLTRAEALQRARDLGRGHGIAVEKWQGLLAFVPSGVPREVIDEGHWPAGHPLWRLAPRAAVDVVLHPGDFSSRWRVRFSGDGRLLGFEESGHLEETPAGPLGDPAAQRGALEAAIQRDLAPGVALKLGEPEIENVERSQGPPGRRFTWHAALGDVDSLEFRATGEYRGDRLVHLEIVPAVRADRPAPKHPLLETLQPLFSLLRAIFLAFLALYACYRFARRAAEGEVPKGRALVFVLFLILFGVVILLADPDMTITSMDYSRLDSSSLMMIRISLLASLSVQGLLLGLAYASGEGEIREGFPGKLTSLDAAVTGRVFSSNVGAAVVFGAAAACWLTALFQILLALAGREDSWLPLTGMSLSFGRAPWLILLLDIPTIALFGAVCALMLPLTLLRRKVRSRPLLIVLLVLAGLLLGNLGKNADLSSSHYLVETAVIVLCLLIPFFGFDLLASIVTLTAFEFLLDVGALVSLVPAWQGWLEPVFPVVGGTLGAFAFAAWYGRRYEDIEVRPQYAGNLARRVALQAEIGAAREAQLRLLPASAPTTPGMTVAASCLPAGSVGGDYYDFFVLDDGRLAFAMAEGGNDGLASALTIALAKGFLLVEVAREDSPTRILQALDEVLGQNLRRTSGATMLACGILDPHRRTLRLARLGEYPRIHVLAALSGAVSEIVPRPGFSSGSVGEVEVLLSPGDLVFAYTDGLPHRLDRQHAGSPEDLLRRAAGWQNYSHAQHLHDAVRRILLPDGNRSQAELNDDLTTLVLRLNSASEQVMEEVA